LIDGSALNFVLVGEAGLHPGKCRRQFLGRKTHCRKIGTDRGKIGQLQAEHLGIPTRVQSDLVVGKHQLRPSLNGFSPLSEKNRRTSFGQNS
jgi:hypothetical protein